MFSQKTKVNHITRECVNGNREFPCKILVTFSKVARNVLLQAVLLFGSRPVSVVWLLSFMLQLPDVTCRCLVRQASSGSQGKAVVDEQHNVLIQVACDTPARRQRPLALCWEQGRNKAKLRVCFESNSHGSVPRHRLWWETGRLHSQKQSNCRLSRSTPRQ